MTRAREIGSLLLLAALVWSGAGSSPAAARPLEVTVTRLAGNRIRVEGWVMSEQPPEALWKVLTDYDHLSEFIPWLSASRLVASSPTRVLEQEGRVQWWFFQRTVHITFEIQEVPLASVRFRAIGGDFLEHQGAWSLENLGGLRRVRYDATLRPAFFLPPLVGAAILKQHLTATLQAIAERAESVSAPPVH